MADLRAALRLSILIVGTAALWLTAWMISGSRRTRAARRLRLFGCWARFVAQTIGLRCRIEGQPPRGAGLLVANHLSYVDVVVLAALSDATFVAKAEVAGWPIVGSLCRFVGTVFVRRAGGEAVTSALMEIEAALDRGRLVVIFPEGTSTDGRQVLPFRPALLEAARLTDRPIGWAALSYFTASDLPPATRAVCWWGDMTLVDHLYRLLQLPAIRVHVTFGAVETAGAADRKQLARALHEAVMSARHDHTRDAGEAVAVGALAVQ